MNFTFAVKDEVVFIPGSKHIAAKLFPAPIILTVTKVFPKAGALWLQSPTKRHEVYRVRTSDVVRIRRPSDDVEADRIAHKKLERAAKKDIEDRMIARRREEFQHLEEYKIRLTAKGLPDQRMKPRYTASNAPILFRKAK